MAGNAYVTRMPLGISGAVTRLQDLTAEPAILDAANPFSKSGLAGKFSGNKFVSLAAGDTIDKVVGFLIRSYPTTTPTDMKANGVTAGFTADIMKRGYMAVTVPKGQAAAAKKGDKVYIRVDAATADSPLGSVVLTPDATAANTPELTNAKVMGPGESLQSSTVGHVEIAYNI